MQNDKQKTPQKRAPQTPQKQFNPTVSAIAPNGHMVELVYDEREERAALLVWDGHRARRVDAYAIDRQTRLVPTASTKSLVEHGVLKLPSGATEYGETEDLVRAIRAYLHRYVDVPEPFERLAANYVLLTWVYDRFRELPYLRRRGDYGTGKTRFLTILGSICYKPIFASGAATASPIFHLLNQIRGTLIIDEADYRFSDEHALIAKILNAGNVDGYPVLRSESVNGKDFRPRAFRVYGPKVIGMRGRYDDAALESRFLTDTSSHPSVREDIPLNLPSEAAAEAAILRDKLLLYRFRTFAHAGAPTPIEGHELEPRMQQILSPLLSVCVDETDRQAIHAHAATSQAALREARGQSLEAEVLTVIRKLMQDEDGAGVSVRAVAKLHGRAYLDGVSRPISPRSMGHILRTKLNLPTRKSNGVFVIPKNEADTLKRLYDRYSVSEADVASLREALGELTRVDYGDVRGCCSVRAP